jgi:hypothetical protein
MPAPNAALAAEPDRPVRAKRDFPLAEHGKTTIYFWRLIDARRLQRPDLSGRLLPNPKRLMD